MNKSKIEKLSFLNEKILQCQKCPDLFRNGIAIPYWTTKSKWMIMAEAPGRDEVKEEFQSPLVGSSGRVLFKALQQLGFKREDFLIINTIQHRPVKNNKNGKPSPEEIKNCRFWIEKYIRLISPRGGLVFGNFAMSYFFGDSFNSGITKECGVVRKVGSLFLVPCIHPASVLYNPENKSLFEKSLLSFKNEVNTRRKK